MPNNTRKRAWCLYIKFLCVEKLCGVCTFYSTTVATVARLDSNVTEDCKLTIFSIRIMTGVDDLILHHLVSIVDSFNANAVKQLFFKTQQSHVVSIARSTGRVQSKSAYTEPYITEPYC